MGVVKTPGAFWIAVPVWLLALAGTAGAAQLRGAMLTPNWSVQGSTMYMTPGQQRGEIAAVARMGGNVVRLPVDWAELQPDGRIDAMYQAQLDQAVAAAGEYGQAVILNIIGTPCWASLQPSCPLTRKSHMDAPRPAAFAEVTRYLLTRYPMLYAYEVWNEPNCCPPEARSWNGSVADFAQVVIAAVEARNETRSHTRVIVGGFLMDSSRWLKALYREGMRVSDGISIHPYSLAGEGSAWVNPAK